VAGCWGVAVHFEFLVRNPHIHYNDWFAFNGMTGVDRAAQILAGAPVPV
jgi:hypothetical protein